MNPFQEKITQLRQSITLNVKPLLGKRVIIADAPYYNNIGDLLIWRGTIDFLRENGIELLDSYGAGYFSFPKLDKDVTILLMGGGNFGDLWRVLQDIRLEIIARYPDNRIVMLPQSICYCDTRLIDTDSRLMAAHPDLHLFARDHASFNILSTRFSRNHIHLAPDMAFCIDDSLLAPHRNREKGKTLFLLRVDKELPHDAPTSLQEADVTSDWSTTALSVLTIRILNRAGRIANALRRRGISSSVIDRAIGFSGNRFIRDSLTKKGCEFLEPFSRIVTTRLHPMILSVLLHKPAEYIDNSYGKLSSFALTWLHDLPAINPYVRD